MASEYKIGYYSRKNHILMDRCVSFPPISPCIYRTPSGEEVMVTAVFDSKEKGDVEYMWPDAECVGPVAEWVRAVPSSRPEVFVRRLLAQ